MKKKNNKTLITILCIALGFVVLGSTLIGVGVAQGGTFRISNRRIGVFNIPAWNHEKTTNKQYHFTPSNTITSLDLDVDAASVEVRRGTTFDISTRHINKSKMQFNENATNASLTVDNVSWSTESIDKEIFITLPETVTDLNIDLNLGDVEIMSGVNIKNLNIKVNAGDVDIENSTVETANIDLDLGDFDFSGEFSKSFTYENNAGDSDFNFRNPQNHYDYDISGNLGSFTVGDDYLDAINGDYKVSNNANRLLKVNVDLGDLSIEFSNSSRNNNHNNDDDDYDYDDYDDYDD